MPEQPPQPRDPHDRPEYVPDEPDRPVIRPLSQRTTRVLVIAGLLVALGVSFLAAYILVESAQDPDIQRQIEEIRALEEGRAADTSGAVAADSLATDSLATDSLATEPPAPQP